MKQDYLKDEGNALRVQKHQLNNTDDKLSEIDSLLSNIQKEQSSNDESLDDMMASMENLLQNSSSTVSIETIDELFCNKLSILAIISPRDSSLLDCSFCMLDNKLSISDNLSSVLFN